MARKMCRNSGIGVSRKMDLALKMRKQLQKNVCLKQRQKNINQKTVFFI